MIVWHLFIYSSVYQEDAANNLTIFTFWEMATNKYE